MVLNAITRIKKLIIYDWLVMIMRLISSNKPQNMRLIPTY